MRVALLRILCLLATVLSAHLLQVAPLRAQQISFFDIDGSWTGRGWIARSFDTAQERGSCRLTVRTLVAGADIQLEGRCPTARGGTRLLIRVGRRKDGSLAAQVALPKQDLYRNYSGRLVPQGLQLLSDADRLENGILLRSQLDIRFEAPGVFSLSELVSAGDGPEARQVLNMVFEKEQEN
jgi:hypothetical protein